MMHRGRMSGTPKMPIQRAWMCRLRSVHLHVQQIRNSGVVFALAPPRRFVTLGQIGYRASFGIRSTGAKG